MNDLEYKDSAKKGDCEDHHKEEFNCIRMCQRKREFHEPCMRICHCGPKCMPPCRPCECKCVCERRCVCKCECKCRCKRECGCRKDCWKEDCED